MIVKMKKATLLCLESDKIQALEDLRELGVLHVNAIRRSEANDYELLSKEIAATDRVASILGNYKPFGSATALSGKETCHKASALIDAELAATKRLDTLQRERDRIEPWGNFDPKTVETLKANGINVYLCMGAKSDMDSLPEGASVTLVSDVKGAAYFMVVSQKPLDPLAIHAVAIPQTSLKALKFEIANAVEEIAARKADLSVLAANTQAIKAYQQELAVKAEFLLHRDTMAVSGVVAYLQGYVPVPAADKLSADALEKGWGLILEDPTSEDMPPTLLQNPKWMKIISPLFEMVGISPGYREFDVTAFFLIFFTIFFGMIVADAGYALGFLTVAILARFVIKDPAMKTPLNLFTLLSCSAFVWGWLNGVIFGIPFEILEKASPKLFGYPILCGIPLFSDPEHSEFAQHIGHKFGITDMKEMPDKFTQWFCFFLAALHLSAARLFRTITEIRHNWRAIGDLGWALILWANFFTAVNLIVFNGSFPSFGIWLYVAAIVLIFGSIDFHDAGHVMHAPFALIGSFVDVLSYIRLFAVGMSGFFIAKCFNSMGGMAYDALPPSLAAIGLIFAIGVIAFGHFLNIALAFLGVLVHAIRLNALEFSNQMELQWTGVKYKPFAKDNPTNKG